MCIFVLIVNFFGGGGFSKEVDRKSTKHRSMTIRHGRAVVQNSSEPMQCSGITSQVLVPTSTLGGVKNYIWRIPSK